jgi:hypothetical protein
MSGYLANLITRATEAAPTVVPRPAPVFEPLYRGPGSADAGLPVEDDIEFEVAPGEVPIAAIHDTAEPRSAVSVRDLPANAGKGLILPSTKGLPTSYAKDVRSQPLPADLRNEGKPHALDTSPAELPSHARETNRPPGSGRKLPDQPPAITPPRTVPKDPVPSAVPAGHRILAAQQPATEARTPAIRPAESHPAPRPAVPAPRFEPEISRNDVARHDANEPARIGRHEEIRPPGPREEVRMVVQGVPGREARANPEPVPAAEARTRRESKSAPTLPTRPAEPAIQVTIGRIEVRAETPRPPVTPMRVASPILRLEDYLRQRSEGRRS